MAALKAAASERQALNTCSAGEVLALAGVYSLAAALVVSDTIDMCVLPAGMVPEDLILSVDDLDSHGTPAIVLDVGIYDSVGSTTDADAFIASSTVAQAGGVARLSAVAGRKIAPVDYDRLVRITVSTAPATGATTGQIRCTLLARAKGYDD